MKKFIYTIFSFTIFAAIILLLCESIYYHTGWFERKVNGWEVYAAIRQSKTKQKKKKLIIGDSVAMQFFPCDNEHDTVVSLACNQAIGMAGYYFLLNNYIKTNRDNLPEKVILLITPMTLGNNLDGFAFHYFLKPFYTQEYMENYSQYLLDRCQQIPFYWMASCPFVRSSSYTLKYCLSTEEFVLVSPISQEFLLKINHLLMSLDIQFSIVPLPVCEDKRDSLNTKYRLCAHTNELPIDILFSLAERTIYFPKELFVDDIHLTNQALKTIDKYQFIK